MRIPVSQQALEDGRPYKAPKQRLKGRGLTPEQYREKWGLPSSYPMVAPNYAKQRSELAKTLGLGQIRRNVAVAPAGDEASALEPVPGDADSQSAEAPKRRGRPRTKVTA